MLRTWLLLLFSPPLMFSCSWSRQPASDFLSWPVLSARLTQEFKANPYDKHLGIDLAAAHGTPIIAAHGGTVVYSGSGFRGYGKMILIENKNGWATLYGHLAKSHVKTGQRVYQGQGIGKMGRTGRASGVHLHFEVRYNRIPQDPLAVLPDRSRIQRLSLKHSQ